MDFLKSDAGKKLGKAALSIGAGALEKRRSKKALEAGLSAREAAAKEQKEKGQKSFETMLQKLRDRPAVTQASEDAIQSEKEAAEALIAAGDKRSQEQRGDIVSALQSGDPRTAATLLDTLDKMGATDDASRAMALSKKAGAEGKRAALTEREKDFQSTLDQMLMERGATAADEGRRELLDLQERREGVDPAATASGVQTGTALASLLKDYDFGNPGGEGGSGEGEGGGQTSGFLDFLNTLPGRNSSEEADSNAMGGKIKYKKGGYMADEGFKTKGEFNHKTNKKAVIDEEDGKKEAELTGGEIVFNPKQTRDMEKLIEQDDARGLLKFMKELLSEPQFQD